MSAAPGWATLRAHRSPVRTLSISKNGLHLVSGDDEGYVILWSLESRRPLAIWRANDNALLTTDFWNRNEEEEEDALIITHGRDNKLRIWRNPLSDKASQQHYNVSPLPSDVPDPSEKYPKPWLVYTQDVNALNFCSIALSQRNLFAAPATIASERIDIYGLDEHFMVSRPFKALDASDALPLNTQLEDEAAQNKRRGLLGAVMALKFTKDSLVAGYESGHVARFDLDSGRVSLLVQEHKSPILSLTICGDNTVYASSADRKISVIDIRTGDSRIATQLVHRGVASIDAIHHPDHSLLITAGWDGKVRLFSTTSQDNQMSEIESFPGGRQLGITNARIREIDQTRASRRLRPLPSAWIVVAGKDGRIGLHAYNTPSSPITSANAGTSDAAKPSLPSISSNT